MESNRSQRTTFFRRLTACMLSGFILLIVLGLPQSGRCAEDAAEAYFTPWSGYWWPFTSGGLVNGYGNWGHPAPMEKYDQLTTGAYPGIASQWERLNHYDPEAMDWIGQCHAWASAAVLENIGFYPSSYNNIIFRVGDKKGLLTVCHDADPTIGESVRDNPDVFHAWLLNYIKINRKAFVADLGSAAEAWFYPIYKYDMQLTPGAGETRVTCQIWYADDNVTPDIQGTVAKTRIYTYTLYVNGSGAITGGRWTGTSAGDPPKSVFYPLAPVSTSPYLDYQKIREIAVHKDDHLESGDLVRLLPGTHNLILLNPDVYTIEALAGDRLTFQFTKLDRITESIQVTLINARGATIWQNNLASQLSLSLTASEAPYRLTFSRSNYAGGGIYRVVFDQHRANERWLGDFQKGTAWNGVAVTNSSVDRTIANLQVVAYNAQNQPITTLKGPESLGALRKDVWVAETLPMHLHERPLLSALKIIADEPAQILHLNGISGQSMAGYGKERTSRRWIVADTSGLFNVNKSVSWGLINRSADAVTLNGMLFTGQGLLSRQVNLTIGADAIARYAPGSNPFYSDPEGGWIDLQVPYNAPMDAVSGFFRWTKDGTGGCESLYALSRIGTQFSVPHVAATPLWKTEVTLINLTGAVNEVEVQLLDGTLLGSARLTLNPYEKTSRQMSALFPGLSDAVLGQGALRITSQSIMTGYFAYQTGKSSAAFELATEDQAAPRLVMPHSAVDSYWWTGLALYNPWGSAVQATLIPVDANGVEYPELAANLIVAPFSKKIFTLAGVFDSSFLSNVAWLRVESTGNGVMGLFMYGDMSHDVLSGAELFTATD